VSVCSSAKSKVKVFPSSSVKWSGTEAAAAALALATEETGVAVVDRGRGG